MRKQQNIHEQMHFKELSLREQLKEKTDFIRTQEIEKDKMVKEQLQLKKLRRGQIEEKQFLQNKKRNLKIQINE